MSPATGELLQLPRFRGRERELLFIGAVVSILDKVLGVVVVWWGGCNRLVLEAMLIIQGASTGVMSVSVRASPLTVACEVTDPVVSAAPRGHARFVRLSAVSFGRVLIGSVQ